MNIQPVRLQRKRTKGFRLVSPNGLPIVCVTRPGLYGNPFDVKTFGGHAVPLFRELLRGGIWDMHIANYMADRGINVPGPQFWLRIDGRRAIILRDLASLRGKNLACFCPPDHPCHADVLLELANR